MRSKNSVLTQGMNFSNYIFCSNCNIFRVTWCSVCQYCKQYTTQLWYGVYQLYTCVIIVSRVNNYKKDNKHT